MGGHHGGVGWWGNGIMLYHLLPFSNPLFPLQEEFFRIMRVSKWGWAEGGGGLPVSACKDAFCGSFCIHSQPSSPSSLSTSSPSSPQKTNLFG